MLTRFDGFYYAQWEGLNPGGGAGQGVAFVKDGRVYPTWESPILRLFGHWSIRCSDNTIGTTRADCSPKEWLAVFDSERPFADSNGHGELPRCRISSCHESKNELGTFRKILLLRQSSAWRGSSGSEERA